MWCCHIEQYGPVPTQENLVYIGLYIKIWLAVDFSKNVFILFP